MPLRLGSRPGEGSVLVIDDDEIALQSIADLLTTAGFEVHAQVSPIGATQVIATRGIVAAVIDLNMPVMRGDRFIALIRGWDKIRDLPVVLVSGESADTVREVSARLPDVAVVTKAQMADKLVPTLRRVLGSRPSQASRGSLPARPSMGTSAAAVASVSATGATRRSFNTPASPQSRPLSRLASSSLTMWQGLLPNAPLGPMMAGLVALQRETELVGLSQLAQLVELARHALEGAMVKSELLLEADVALTELLQLLVQDLPEKCQAFERSLALPLLRARLERARNLRP